MKDFRGFQSIAEKKQLQLQLKNRVKMGTKLFAIYLFIYGENKFVENDFRAVAYSTFFFANTLISSLKLNNKTEILIKKQGRI